jgi:chaperone BCS1
MMNQSRNQNFPSGDATTGFLDHSGVNPPSVLLDTLFPGFSPLTTTLKRYSGIDVSIYFLAFLMLGGIIWLSRYVLQWFWDVMDYYLMSTADIRIDDEMYNMVMAWVAQQKFAKKSRRFVVNTNLNSRMWWLFRDFGEDGD